MSSRSFSLVTLLFALSALGPTSAQEPAPALAPQAPSSTGAQAPAATFAEVVKATAVTVTVDVRDAAGKVPAQIAARDFVVLEDGVEQLVIGAELATPAPAAAGPGPGAALSSPVSAPAAEPWQVVVYVDSPTVTIQTAKGAAQGLAARAAQLVALGTVEVVVADPTPKRLLQPTRDAARLSAALDKLGDKGGARNELARLRSDFIVATDADNLEELGSRTRAEAPERANPSSGASAGTTLYRNDQARGGSSNSPSGQSATKRLMLVRATAQQEYQLLARQRALLLDWLALTERPSRPRALVLVSDGFDLDPTEFYLSYLRDASLLSSAQSDLERLRSGAAFEQLSKTVAASGWQVVAISLSQPGAQSASSAEQSGRGRYRGFTAGGTGVNDAPGSGLAGFLLRAPIDPLRTVTEETAGELALTGDQLASAVAALGERVRLTYQVPRDPDGAIHRLEVRVRPEGWSVRAPRSVSAAAPDVLMAARARHVLSSGKDEGSSFPVTLAATAAPYP
jgi:hypothetical protein